MLYITLHNLHSWGKQHMTKAGDICVASELAKSDNSVVHVAAISDNDLSEVKNLYNDTKFDKIDDRLPELKKSDVVLVTMLEFSDLSDEYRRLKTKEFYEWLLKVEAVVAVMNIHHDKEFYLRQIETIEDKEISELAKRILEECVYIVHDPCMKLDQYDSRFIEQIVYFDRNKIKDRYEKNEGRTLSFYRPASFKGFCIWAEESKSRKDLLLISNVLYNPRLKDTLEEISDKVLVFKEFEDYEDVDKSAIISQPYNVESEIFQKMIEISKDCMNTTDYIYLLNLNDGMKPDYLIIENAMIEAVYNGLPLRWSEKSILTMDDSAKKEALLYNSMNLVEQIEYLSNKFDAAKTVEYLKGLSK